LNRLADEGGHGVGPFALDRFFQQIGRHLARCARVVGRAWPRLKAIGIGAIDMREAGNPRLEHRPIGFDAGGRHGGERRAVIAPLAANDFVFGRLAGDLPIVAGGFESRLVGFGAAGSEEEMIDARIG
jgi:hypothetical protein